MAVWLEKYVKEVILAVCGAKKSFEPENCEAVTQIGFDIVVLPDADVGDSALYVPNCCPEGAVSRISFTIEVGPRA